MECKTCGWCHQLDEESLGSGVMSICLEHMDPDKPGENLKLTEDDMSTMPEGCACYARMPSNMSLSEFMAWQNTVKSERAARHAEKTQKLMSGIRGILGGLSVLMTVSGLLLGWLALPEGMRDSVLKMFGYH